MRRFTALLLVLAGLLPGATAQSNDADWVTRLVHSARVIVDLPAEFEPMPDSWATYGTGEDEFATFFSLLQMQGDDLATACAYYAVNSFETAGTPEMLDDETCFITSKYPSHPNHLLIAYPVPWKPTALLTEGDYPYLAIAGPEGVDLLRIARSARFPDSPPAPLFVAGILDVMQGSWFYREDVADWPALRAEALALVDENSTLDDAYNAARFALDRLAEITGDNHPSLQTGPDITQEVEGRDLLAGFYIQDDTGIVYLVFPGSPAEAAGLRTGDRVQSVNGVAPDERVHGVDQYDLVVERENGPVTITVVPDWFDVYLPPITRRLENVGYVETFSTFGDVDALERYVQDAHAGIKTVDGSAPACGWVVDLRRNHGGVIAPILSALLPLNSAGPIMGVVDALGEEYVLENGYGHIMGGFLEDHWYNLDFYAGADKTAPIAILVSRETASAGEMSAISLTKRPDAATRIFGEHTYSVTSTLNGPQLYDGGQLWLTLTVVTDREGTLYPDGVEPDETIPVDFTRHATADDPVLNAALDWLATQPACQ